MSHTFTYQPINRTQLAMFSSFTNDFNPMHLDIDYARIAGQPDVVCQGTLTFSLIAEAIKLWASPKNILTLDANLIRPIYPSEMISVIGEEHDQGTWTVKVIGQNENLLAKAIAKIEN